MFERLSRSWQLVKSSASVLAQDRALLVFPLVSAIAACMDRHASGQSAGPDFDPRLLRSAFAPRQR